MKAMNETIPLTELEIREDSDEEHNRVERIIESIKLRGSSNKKLTEHEKNFFGLYITISQQNNGRLEDYPFASNYLFKITYLAYYKDVTGGSKYYTIDSEKVREFLRANNNSYSLVDLEHFLREVNISEAQTNLKYLYQVADEWESVIKSSRHSEKVLQEISTETREQIGTLKNQPEFNPQIYGAWKFRYSKIKILLQAKYIYLASQEVFEKMQPEDFLLSLNGIKIEFNEYSIIHILSRHFGAITKPYNTQKSFHNMNFFPEQLNIQLRDVFERIDKSLLYKDDSINKITFLFNDKKYRVFIQERLKQVKGTSGNIPFMRIETFFPLEEEKDLKELEADYCSNKIDENLYTVESTIKHFSRSLCLHMPLSIASKLFFPV